MNYGNLIEWQTHYGKYLVKIYAPNEGVAFPARYLFTLKHPLSSMPEAYYTNYLEDGRAWARDRIRDMKSLEAIGV